MPKVVLIRCETYSASKVSAAVARGFELLGVSSATFKPGEKILLKPNLLSASAPGRAVTTHPAVFRAVAEALTRFNVELTWGDSPAVTRMERAAEKSGILAVARELGISPGNFKTGETVPTPPDSLVTKFLIAEAARSSDGIVSISKLKTHGFTTLTGALKNQFGCIPGLHKAAFHAQLPNPDDFSRMIVDLNRLLRPRLSIMDGITAMEGNGPGSGDPRSMNVLLFSFDPGALDAVACKLIGLDPQTVPMIRWAERSGFSDLENLQIYGDPMESFQARDFKIPRFNTTSARNAFLVKVFRRFVLPKIVIHPDKCVNCGQCVKICPARPKALRSNPESPCPEYDRTVCIRCYCCQEICPEQAITIQRTLAGRIAKIST